MIWKARRAIVAVAFSAVLMSSAVLVLAQSGTCHLCNEYQQGCYATAECHSWDDSSCTGPPFCGKGNVNVNCNCTGEYSCVTQFVEGPVCRGVKCVAKDAMGQEVCSYVDWCETDRLCM